MSLKLLKFDIIHPSDYLNKKKREWSDLEDLSLAEYRKRLISLRSNYSDFYTYHLNQVEGWEAEEFFLLDPTFFEKVAKGIFDKNIFTQKFIVSLCRFLWKSDSLSFRGKSFIKKRLEQYVIKKYIERFQPDVIFVRSQPIPSRFWQQFKKRALLVSRLSARLPFQWHPNHWDLIYTDQPDFKTFFELHGVKTIINNQGFDKRIVSELSDHQKNDEVVFVGGLGTQNFSKRTFFINTLIEDLDHFKWWGYWWDYGGDGRSLADFPRLAKSFQGPTSGLEMFQIYRDSAIVINDYVDTANGIGFNQRMFEVMGSGGFMLTREAPNFKEQFPEGIFATYSTKSDLLEKIAYYQQNRTERDRIAARGQEYVLNNFDYKNIVNDFEKDLKAELNSKSF